MRLISILLLLVLSDSCSASEPKSIALSFDDVPRHEGAFYTSGQRTAKLIAALKRAGVEQAGFFVTTGNLDKPYGKGGESRIRAYVDAGHVIANHSDKHPWLSRTPVDDYLADLDRAGEWLEGHAGLRPWFRFPYLDEGGKDLEKRDKVRSALRGRQLRNAYVTVDNYDWYLDGLASRARADRQEMDLDQLRTLYVETLVQASNFYNDIALQAIGTSPAHVLLLHETDLAALYVEDLVQALREDGWRIITIDEAYTDPIASIEPDTWFLGNGRVAAIAHSKGWQPADLVHERSDEGELDALFAARVVAPKGTSGQWQQHRVEQRETHAENAQGSQ